MESRSFTGKNFNSNFNFSIDARYRNFKPPILRLTDIEQSFPTLYQDGSTQWQGIKAHLVWSKEKLLRRISMVIELRCNWIYLNELWKGFKNFLVSGDVTSTWKSWSCVITIPTSWVWFFSEWSVVVQSVFSVEWILGVLWHHFHDTKMNIIEHPSGPERLGFPDEDKTYIWFFLIISSSLPSHQLTSPCEAASLLAFFSLMVCEVINRL